MNKSGLLVSSKFLCGLFAFIGAVPSVPTELTKQETKALLQAHNDFRGKVSPPGSNIRLLTWDNDLAGQSQAYVNKCIFAHSDPYTFDPYGRIGENIYITSKTLTTSEDIVGAVTAWYNENTDYDFVSNICTPNKMCGHYTQVVWDNTYKVGCGITRCKGNVEVGASKYTKPTMIICKYGPSGNVRPLFASKPRQPYQKGAWCSACPEEAPHCIDKLCHGKKAKGPEDGITPKATPSTPATMSTAGKSSSTTATKSSTIRTVKSPKTPTIRKNTTVKTSLQCNFCEGGISVMECLGRKQYKACNDTNVGSKESLSSNTSPWSCASFWENDKVKMDCVSNVRCQELTASKDAKAHCCVTNLCNTGAGRESTLMSLSLLLACSAVVHYLLY